MKRPAKREVPWLRPVGRPEPVARPAALEEAVYLLQVHPVPQSRTEILSIAAHLVRRFAAAQQRDVPGLSEDAARFLAHRSWTLDDLARRVWQAVAANDGALITASDLSE